MQTKQWSLQDAKNKFSAVVDAAKQGKAQVITRRGVPSAVVLSMEEFEKFQRYEAEKAPYYRHDYEGDDDMPAHIKSCLLGNSVTIPITKGTLNLCIWQVIYLCEHRNRGGSRHFVATIQGQAI